MAKEKAGLPSSYVLLLLFVQYFNDEKVYSLPLFPLESYQCLSLCELPNCFKPSLTYFVVRLQLDSALFWQRET